MRHVLQRFPAYLRQFQRDEDGAILLFSLFAFFIILLIGGIAVDVSNHERVRTNLQGTLDGAVLAAASLTQDLDPEAVVESYLASAGFGDLDVEVTSTREEIAGTLVGRTVSATVETGVNTFLMHMLGQDHLAMNVSSEASERVEDIEISLVLDVSYSMTQNANGSYDSRARKLNRLKGAASDFVHDILDDAEPGRISISVVPYSTRVNPGMALLESYTVSDEHNFSHCIDFEADDFLTTAISTTEELQRTGHFIYSNHSEALGSKTTGWWSCRTDAGFQITPFSSSATDLDRQINALTALGHTSIEVGAKWGVALLDPSSERVVSDLIDDGLVDAAFRSRPRPYVEEGVMKILVLMTDGENTVETRLNPTYAEGHSSVWRMRNSSGTTYYTLGTQETSSANDGRDDNENYFFPIRPSSVTGSSIWNNQTLYNSLSAGQRSGFTETRLTWPQVWAEMSPYWYGYNIWGRRMNNSNKWSDEANTFWNAARVLVQPDEKDRRLRNICTAAQTAGIVIFTIGFEVPKGSRSEDLLMDCASDDTRYFPVEDEELSAAFDMIASSINMLRLTK